MSLDIYVYNTDPVKRVKGTGVFVRENGSKVELTVEQVKEKFPNYEFSDEPEIVYDECVFDYNITHNLGIMAGQCGVYEALWRPYRLHPDFTDNLVGDEEYKFEDEHPMKTSDIKEKLIEGYSNLVSDPDHYRTFNPSNGWGSYDDLVTLVSKYIDVVNDHPNAIIRVSR